MPVKTLLAQGDTTHRQPFVFQSIQYFARPRPDDGFSETSAEL